MEFNSVNSKLKLEDTKLLTEIKNLVFPFIDKKYLTITYDSIKSFKIVSWKPISYMIYVFGIMWILSYFITTKEVLEGGYSYVVEKSFISRVLCVVFGLLIILIGYFYDKKFGDYKTLNVKYFEGKVKSSQIFTSLNKEELSNIEKEIQSRIK